MLGRDCYFYFRFFCVIDFFSRFHHSIFNLLRVELLYFSMYDASILITYFIGFKSYLSYDLKLDMWINLQQVSSFKLDWLTWINSG